MRARWPAGDATSANYGRDATWRPFAAKQGTKSSWFTNKTFLFVNGILSNYFKTFIACQKSIPESFIKIVGPVFEIFGNKTGGHSFVIIRIHFQLISFSIQSKSVHVEY